MLAVICQKQRDNKSSLGVPPPYRVVRTLSLGGPQHNFPFGASKKLVGSALSRVHPGPCGASAKKLARRFMSVTMIGFMSTLLRRQLPRQATEKTYPRVVPRKKVATCPVWRLAGLATSSFSKKHGGEMRNHLQSLQMTANAGSNLLGACGNRMCRMCTLAG